MWIERVLIHQIPPFRDDNSHPIEFCRGFNLVRGANGIGKTTVLESLALIGHLPLFRVEVCTASRLAETNVCVNFVIEAHDIAAMRSVIDRAESLIDPSSRLAEAIRGARLDELTSYIDRITANTGIEFGLNIFERKGSYPDLKDILSNEQRLSSDVTLNVTDASHAALLIFLVAIGRPETSGFEATNDGTTDYKKPFSWYLTPRRKLLEQLDQNPRQAPGFVGYFHTDMYRWGVGNDIRESPKELFHKSTPRMISERLRLFPLVEPSTGPWIREFKLLSELWKKIVSPEGAKRLSMVRLREYSPGELIVEVGLSNDPINIVSSGENQALFLLFWTIAYSTYNSCLLVDEPEIHLSPGAAHRVIEFLQALAKTRDCQVICATHAAVIPRGVRAKRNALSRMIYLEGPDKRPLDGEDAVQAISRDFQETIDELIAALRPASD